MIVALYKRYAQLITFAMIGVVNTLIHGSVLLMTVEWLALTVPIAHLVAFNIANLSSYLMNSSLTFKIPLSLRRYMRFYMTSLLSLGLTLLVAWASDLYGLHYLLGFGLVVMVVPLLTFVVMKFWTFAHFRCPRM